MTDYERFGDYQPSERGGSAWGFGITLLLIGLGAGALTALLFAPRAGAQTRRMLRRKYEDALENINERAEEWRERGSEWVEKARDLADKAGDAADYAREKVRPLARKR
jgi:gas vesicle protein